MKNYYKSPLLIPISVGSMKLKNRLVTLPMGMMLADEHGAITGGRNSRTISYYEEKAKGGFALIIAEGDILSEDTLESEKRLVECVHQHGAKIITQIGHPGRQITVSEYGVHAPSPIPCMMYGVIPEELTVEEIKAIEQMLVHNAMLVQKAGLGMMVLKFTLHMDTYWQNLCPTMPTNGLTNTEAVWKTA